MGEADDPAVGMIRAPAAWVHGRARVSEWVKVHPRMKHVHGRAASRKRYAENIRVDIRILREGIMPFLKVRSCQ